MRPATPGPTERVALPHLPGQPVAPITLRIDRLAALLNAELADDPVYDGVELQWFDDEVHGTGMLAFLSRREDRTVDYYLQPGLRLDRRGYAIGGGTRSWNVTPFEEARLAVAQDGVDAHVRFTDVDGRLVEVRVDDRDGVARRRARLLAPVSAGILRPTSLLLVWMNAFDLVRVTATPPSVRIDGRSAALGRLPGVRVHRRHLIKYAASVVVVEVNPDTAEQPTPHSLGHVTAVCDDHTAEIQLVPPLDLRRMADGDRAEGRWHVTIDGARITGGRWSATRASQEVHVDLDRLERWRPGTLPWLMRLVTTVVPVFRRWPTTYAWHGTVQLGHPSPSGSWRRTGGHDGQSYRRATGS
ncbi:hypothetical protein HP550_15855 [Cellulomonas humilata]|uniref:Uncharacterized protein n=1 Tax=Cellulomonas humilata TaxID=144055 RepID=A0A7Y6DYK1_9CELL|nr:hypothetical protein [Cellulomonas humilata]NUU18728.1 hypothetical protein [Cellulomonas humilata]